MRLFFSFLLGVGVSMLYQSRRMDVEARFHDLADRLNGLVIQSRALLGEARGEFRAAMQGQMGSIGQQMSETGKIVRNTTSAVTSRAQEMTERVSGAAAEAISSLPSSAHEASVASETVENISSTAGTTSHKNATKARKDGGAQIHGESPR